MDYFTYHILLKGPGRALSDAYHVAYSFACRQKASEIAPGPLPKISEVAWPAFKSMLKSGKEHVVHAYHFISPYIIQAFHELSHLVGRVTEFVKNALFHAPENFAAAAKAMQDTKGSDPISPQISAAVDYVKPALTVLNDVYIATVLAGGNLSFYGAMLVAQVFHREVPIIVETFTGRSDKAIIPTSTHPQTDQFVMQMGLAGAAWFLEKSVTVITSHPTPIQVIKTIAIFAGACPKVQHRVMETQVWKKIQPVAHTIFDKVFEWIKIPVKQRIRKSVTPLGKLWRNPWVQQKLRSNQQFCVQEIHKWFDVCAPIAPSNRDKAWDFMTWFGEKKMMDSGKQVAKAAAEALVDKTAEVLIIQAWKAAKVTMSTQSFLWAIQRVSARNRLLAAAMIVANGGKTQTVQACAVRVLTAGTFYYTSSVLATPIMYGFFAGKYVVQLRTEYYQDRRQQIIDTGREQNLTEEEISRELVRQGYDKDQIKEAAKRLWNDCLNKVEAKLSSRLVCAARKISSFMQCRSFVPLNNPVSAQVKKEEPSLDLSSSSRTPQATSTHSLPQSFAAFHFSTKTRGWIPSGPIQLEKTSSAVYGTRSLQP